MRRALVCLLLAGCNRGGCPDVLYPYVDQPRTLPRIEPPADLGSLSAERCGSCHTAIYAEWKSSLMAQARTNPFFLHERAESKTAFLCGRCHHPLENQEPLWVDGLLSLDPLVPRARPNPGFDEPLADEGVTCAVCHLSPDLAHWPGQAPPAWPRRGALVPVVSARRLPDAAAPHPLEVGPALDAEGRLCARCHQFDPPGVHVARPPLDTMAEYAAYRAGGGKETCLGCHMPAVERAATASAPVRVGHDHRFRGVQDGAFMAAYVLARPALTAEGVEVALENRAGHNVPTGEPARVLSVRAALRAGGRVQAERRVRILRDILTPEVVERFDAALRVGEARVIRLPFAPAERAAADQVQVTVSLFRYERDHPLVQGADLWTPGLETPIHTWTASIGVGRASP